MMLGQLSGSTAKIYSFDLFDTVITRSVVHPAGIFGLMQQRLRLETKVWKDRSKHILGKFINTPSRREADVIGDYLFDGDSDETHLTSIAPPLRLFGIVYAFFTKYWPTCLKNKISDWPEGSCARSGWLVRAFLKVRIRVLLMTLGGVFYEIFLNRQYGLLQGAKRGRL